MNRRAQLFVPMVVFMTFLVLVTALIALTVKYNVRDSNGEPRTLGEVQANVFKTYQAGENARLFITRSAKLSSKIAVKDLAKKESGCGTYLGFSIWSSPGKECYPNKEEVEKKFVVVFNNRLNSFLTGFSDASIPQDSYKLTLQQNRGLKIMGFASSPIQISFGSLQQTEQAKLDNEINLIWPVNGDITSCFGYRSIKLEGKESESDWHDGIDIGVVVGTDVVAPADGVVEYVCQQWVAPSCACSIGIKPGEPGACQDPKLCRGKCGNFGNYIIVKHSDNFYTQYGHLSEVLVNDGQSVKRGSVIAKSGNTGLSGGPHVHFEIYANRNFNKEIAGDYSRNPLCYLSSIPESKFRADSCKNPDSRLCQVKPGIVLPASQENVYSLPINFKTELNYTFEEYDVLSGDLKKISENINRNCMKSGQDECIAELLAKEKNFEWSLSCGNEEENTTYNLIETMLLCQQSNEDGYCLYDIPKTKELIEINIKRNVQISGVEISSQNIKETFEQAFPQIANNLAENSDACEEVNIKIKNGIASLSAKNCASSGDIEFEYEGELPIYNKLSPGKKVNIVSFIPTKVFNENKNKLEELNPIKKQMRLCAKSKYSLMNDAGAKVPVVYGVSFFVGDVVSPKPVENLIVSDTPNTEKNITVSFDANTEGDMSYYNAYYSETDFNEVKNQGVKFLGRILHSGTATYNEAFNISQDNKQYYFAVTAVDLNGNENTSVVSKPGISIDDLNPGPVEKLEYIKPGLAPVIDVSITPPLHNQDGSMLDDLKTYSIYLKKTTANACLEADIVSTIWNGEVSDVVIDISQPVHTAKVDISKKDSALPGSRYCVVVLAEDETDEAEVNSARYSQNSILFVQI